MQNSDINRILNQIAKRHNTTVSNIRKEIGSAMRIARSNPDPKIQARWEAIPHKGAEPTVDEFIMYMITMLEH